MIENNESIAKSKTLIKLLNKQEKNELRLKTRHSIVLKILNVLFFFFFKLNKKKHDIQLFLNNSMHFYRITTFSMFANLLYISICFNNSTDLMQHNAK